jgi:hypothetical protein
VASASIAAEGQHHPDAGTADEREPPDIEPAETSYRQALALAKVLGMRPLRAHCHSGLGTLYAKTCQKEQARTE